MGNTNSGRRPAHEEMRLRKGQLSTRQLSEIAGVPMNTLDFWAKKGFIKPLRQDGEGKGSRRVWRSTTVAEIHDLIRHIEACPFDHKKIR